ncbi:sensor histidine kinase [Clostridium baratii]|nr:GHKL domain-containing protein [Clostridium baratii]
MLIILPFVISCISMTLILNKIFMPITYILLFSFIFLIFCFCFDESPFAIYVICIDMIFYLIITRDFVVGILSLLVNESMYKIVQSPTFYIISFSLSRIIVLLISLKLDKIYDLNTRRIILDNENSLKFMNMVKSTLVLLILNSNYTYYYSTDVNSTAVIIIMLINRIIIIVCFYFIISMQIKYINWQETKLNNELISAQLEYQKKLYKKRDHYSNLLKMYNHDFKNILNNAGKFLELGKIDEAKDILSNVNSNIKNIINENKNYSNNLIVDIILNELSEKCKSSKIKFSAKCYIPENFKLGDLELSRLFSNLANNSYEACIKQNEIDLKNITFKSYIKDNVLIIFLQNTFNGSFIMKENTFITTKKNSTLHGVGIESIRQIVEYANGILLIDTDTDNDIKLFKYLIKIPLCDI